MSIKKSLILGNIITLEEDMPRAKALVSEDGIIKYIGNENDARSICDNETIVYDYGDNFVYPGFLEAHLHALGTGLCLTKNSFCPLALGESLKEYLEIIREFIEKNPEKKTYFGRGFVVRDGIFPNAKMLDDICLDKPIHLFSEDGHSAWLNTKAMEHYGITKDLINVYGTDKIRVDENGELTGFISEEPAMGLMNRIDTDKDSIALYMKNCQEFCFSNGYTGIYDAGYNLLTEKMPEYMSDFVDEGWYKLRTFAGCIIREDSENVVDDVENAYKDSLKYNNEYFKIIGPKIFSDGVVEAHTALLLEDYSDEAGYKGAGRIVDHKKLVDIYETASRLKMSAHAHTIGDAAIRANLDAIEEATNRTGDDGRRFSLAHLQVVDEEDIHRFAKLGVVAVVAPLWVPKDKNYFPIEKEYLGNERAENVYPIQSFISEGVTTVFHTDFPVTRIVSIPRSIYQAVTRISPTGGTDSLRGKKERISRLDALKSMTINIAYSWHEEERLGSLKVGKIANMTVFDKDFLEDELESLPNAKLISTVVDGKEVFTLG